MKRVFLDASVIIAAILSPEGGSSEVIKRREQAGLSLITSENIIEEVFSKTSKIKKSEQEIKQFIYNSEIIVREKIDDASDLHVVAGAKITKCLRLLTLDKKHLLKPAIKGRFKPLLIVSPEEFLHELLKISPLAF